MRIIGGTLRGRVYRPKADKWPTRPTTDIAKEGLYNILQNRMVFDELICLDLFGGTGSHTFELVSRGSTDVTYVDKYRPACKFVSKTCIEFGIEDKVTIICKDVFQYLAINQRIFDFIFAGPPYPLKRIPDLPSLVMSPRNLSQKGLFVLEHNREHSFENHPFYVHERNYGGTYFSFFQFVNTFAKA